jgi:aryl-alcohol dehydrogenase-like predicted oxidoreductase
MQMRALGRNGPKVSEFGLGCMGMSGGYGPADDKECIATIHAALEAGITMLDTGDSTGLARTRCCCARRSRVASASARSLR